MKLFDRFLGTIESYRMVSRGDRVVVAVSGGPDSIALLHLFRRGADRLGVRLTVAHLNHRLRGTASDADEAFVRDLAERHQLPFAGRRLRAGSLTGPGSLEENARRARYRFLSAVARRTGAARVAVGHQRDDQAETFLMRLLRGSGRTGLGAIHPVRDGWLIRPLLDTPRADILRYLRRHRLPFRNDRSNSDRRLLRNRVRLELMPVLARFQPRIDAVLAATADRLRDEDLLLDALIRVDPPGDRGHLPIERMQSQPPALRPRLLLDAIERAFGDRRRIGSAHLAALMELFERPGGGRRVTLPGGRTAVRRADRIEWIEGDPPPPDRLDPIPLPVPGHCELPRPGLTLRSQVMARRQAGDPARRGGAHRALLDADRVPQPLTVRGRRPGDRFRPLGAPGRRKVQDFFVDRRVPIEHRDGWPLVTAGDRIVWVVGGQIDDLYRVRHTTRHVLVLEQTPADGETFGLPAG